MNPIKILLRLIIAAILGGLIGFEREKHGRVAGFRTHVLVTVGSALIMMVSLYLYEVFMVYHTPQYASGVDPSRIASMVIAGIGFIGAGTIIKSRGSIWGLTTAACLWMAAALGLAVGCGYYFPAVMATIISLSTLVILKYIGHIIKKDWYFNIDIGMEDKKDGLQIIKKALETDKTNILKVNFNKDITKNEVVYSISLRARSVIDESLINKLAQIDGVKSIICYS